MNKKEQDKNDKDKKDTERNELVRAFRALILAQYKELAVEASIGQIAGETQKPAHLAVLRSCPAAIFESFLAILKEVNPNCHLLVIGKEQDAQSVERIYGKNCQVIAIEGKYSAEAIRQYAETIAPHLSETLVLFSRTIHDGDYLNIYETAAELGWKGSIYCQDSNNDTYQIKDMKKYVSVLKLHKALSEWFWQCES